MLAMDHNFWQVVTLGLMPIVVQEIVVTPFLGLVAIANEGVGCRDLVQNTRSASGRPSPVLTTAPWRPRDYLRERGGLSPAEKRTGYEHPSGRGYPAATPLVVRDQAGGCGYDCADFVQRPYLLRRCASDNR